MKANASGTIQQALLHSAERGGGAGLSFCDWEGQRTLFRYDEVALRAARVAASLRARGIHDGDVVAIISTTSLHFVTAFYGVLFAGAIPTCLPPIALGRLADYYRSTARMLRASRAQFLITDERTSGVIDPVFEEVTLPLGRCLETELGENGDELRLVGSADDVCLIQFSSGTTVDPKPVVVTHRKVLENVRAMTSRYPGDLSRHSGVSWLPMYHDMGLIGGLFPATVAGVNIAFLQPEQFIARPELWLRALSETKATISGAPNFALGLVVTRVSDDVIRTLDLSHWEIAMVGAEAVQPSTLERFSEKLAPAGFHPEALTPVYGLSEATLAVAFGDIRTAPKGITLDLDVLNETGTVQVKNGGRHFMSVGTPLPDVKIEIRTGDGSARPEDRLGRIFVSGPSLMVGYFERPEETEKAIQDGWLDTGDLGFLHSGELYIFGRAKDIVLLKGRNHDPEFVEQALQGVEGLRPSRAAAFSVLDSNAHTEVLWVVAECRADIKGALTEVARAARAAVIKNTGLIPEQVHLVESGALPRTSSGKIRRQHTRSEMLDGILTPVMSLYGNSEHVRTA